MAERSSPHWCAKTLGACAHYGDGDGLGTKLRRKAVGAGPGLEQAGITSADLNVNYAHLGQAWNLPLAWAGSPQLH